MKKYILLVLFILCLFNLSAAGQKENSSVEKPVAAVSILPQSYFVRQIAGDTVDLLVLVGEGQSPHSYEPTPVQIAKLSKAQVWILSGTDFETSFYSKVLSQFPSLKVVDGTTGITYRELMEGKEELGEHHEEGHEEEDGHSHAVDRHTWLGRDNAKIMARHIYESLVEINPSMKGVYTENYTILIASIDETFIMLTSQLAGLRGKSILVFHPAFGYFLDEFGITQLSVETGGKEPSARVLAELIEKAKKERIPAIFVQKQFPVSAAQKISAETGAFVVSLDPLSADWLLNLQSIGNALKDAYN